MVVRSVRFLDLIRSSRVQGSSLYSILPRTWLRALCKYQLAWFASGQIVGFLFLSDVIII